MAAAKPILKAIAASFAKNKLGVDPTDIFTLAGEAVSAAEQAKEKMENEHSYDCFLLGTL